MIHRDVTSRDRVGRTPLVELARIGARSARRGMRRQARVAQPVRQRQGPHRRRDDRGRREARACSSPGATLVEPTSGNTGIALAFVAAAQGLHADPDHARAHVEGARRAAALPRRRGGADAGHADARRGRARARSWRASIPGAVDAGAVQEPGQPRGPPAHDRAPEIWDDTDGAVDVFVAGVGTGGTITGVGEVLKEKKPGVRIVAVEPAQRRGAVGRRARQPPDPGHRRRLRAADILNRAIIDEVIAVSEDDAFANARRLAREEGILAGISSGAALAAALDGRAAARDRRARSSSSCSPTAASATSARRCSRT